MSDDGQAEVDRTFDEMTQRQQFLEKVACGTSEFNAGIEVGWSPAFTMRTCNDPEFRELISYSQQQANGNIEKALYDIAHKGNLGAMQMWLFNKDPLHWRDTKRIEVSTSGIVEHRLVVSVVEGAHMLLRERSIEDLQRLAIEATAAEVTSE